MVIDDHGLEVIRKAGRYLEPDNKKDNYAIQVYVVNPSSGGGGTEDMSQIKVKKLAAEVISALKVVTLNGVGQVVIADQQNNSLREAIGIALNAGGVGAEITILQFGTIVDPFFTFADKKKIFLGLNGTLTDVIPTSGWAVPIGYMAAPSTLMIDIDTPIFRG